MRLTVTSAISKAPRVNCGRPRTKNLNFERNALALYESMGRIVEYVVLLSNLSVILGATQYLKPLQGDGYGRESRENFTHLKAYFPREKNEFFGRKVLPVDPHQRKRQPPPRKQMLTSLGLHAYVSDTKGRNSSDHNSRFSDRRNLLPSFSQGFHPRRQSKNYFVPSQKLSRLNNHNNSVDYHKRADGFNRKYANGRSPRYHHSPKVCDPCNSVPWIPLLKVPDSYRQQRTHVTELHPTPHQNLNFDFHAYPTDTHNVLLPPVPLPPPVFDGTISSSFGLPIGNIPTGHGLLAPLTHDLHSINTVDYNSPFNFYTPHGLLENNNVPELSPVPVVPIHDSAQFFQFDSSIPDLVPPPPKPIDVSKVVLTISEDQKPPPPNHKNPTPDLTSQSTALDFHAAKDNTRTNHFGRLEILKSVPLAEFVSSSHQQQLPLYPPLQSEFPDESTSKNDFHQSEHTFNVPANKPHNISYNNHNYNSNNKTSDAKEEASAPKPLTSPSLSWLFSDHTSPPADSKTTASLSSFVATDLHQIASVVNNELRPLTPTPPDHPKNKKIQIIIPYTTKNKYEHDSNAFESVHHEVFHPPLPKSTKPTPPPPPITPPPPSHRSNTEKYLTEMHHIIASNIRELLRQEIDKTQKDQNYPLQNNIDNWTALEYSNHKTVASKAPKEIIAQALAVTSIPGTSISHLLLPSKKIPSEYFVTTPLPVFDEPSPSTYKTDNATVHSRPFTAKPYATTNVYNPTRLPNHEKNYTAPDRGRVNTWPTLNENLVLPEASTRTRTTDRATTPSWTGTFHSPSTGSEKVHIVTPTPQRNRTTAPFRRTTRHARATEPPQNPTRNPLPHSLPLHRLNSTKLEKVSNLTSHFTTNPTTLPSPNATRTETTTAPAVTHSTLPPLTAPQEVLHLSINDIFPFRNKQLPWEENHNRTEGPTVGRQRKSLIKQSNLHKSKAAVGSSS